MSSTAASGPFCGAHGCVDAADAVIDHPRRGELIVCHAHAADHEVIRHV